MTGATIAVDRLTVVARDGRRLLDDVTLSIRSGSRLGVLGRSGAGKTTLALALLGVLRAGTTAERGRIRVGGTDVLTAGQQELRRLRRGVVSYLPQDPASTLTPTMRVGRLLAELAEDPEPAALDGLLADVGLPVGDAFRDRYPHQLSGGQQQRLALARALSGRPAVLVLDEPTTGLDTVTRARVLDLVDRVVRERGMTLAAISHDRSALSRLVDDAIVLADGRLSGPIPDPVPSPSRATRLHRPTVLEAVELGARHGDTTVLEDVTLHLAADEVLGVAGSSGSGKTTLVRALSGLHPASHGHVTLDGARLAAGIWARTPRARTAIQVVPQHAAGALNPRRTVGAELRLRLRTMRGVVRDAADAEIAAVLGAVGLESRHAEQRPHQLSGGEQQRVTLARAVLARPRVLLCDEPTASLDPETATRVLDLVTSLGAEHGIAVLLVSHDLALHAAYGQRLAVLYRGRVVEQGQTADVLDAPRHEHTRDLVRLPRALDAS